MNDSNFKTRLESAVQEVEAVLEAYLPAEEGHQKTVLEAMNYSVRAGGKRLRPLFMREFYHMFGGRGREIEPFMAAMEMIHTFSLIHDDLPCMDNDRLRRGRPTTWVRYGYDMAVLAGDALSLYAFETAGKAASMTEHPERVLKALSLLAEKAGIYGMIGGQTLDVELTDRPIDPEQLDFIYRLKTGALLEGSMMIGAVLAGALGEELARVEELAACVGKAFQIRDDILDLTADEAVLGKPIGSDEKNHKTTYVTLYGMEAAEEAVRELSGRAERILQTLPGEHEFLSALIELLVTREK